jgi:calcineurin-like phosphoesterase family protein
MDRTIINNVNEIVKKDDTLWFLGDWAFGRGTNEVIITTSRKAINCKDIRLVFGNHDKLIRNNKQLQGLFTECGEWFCQEIGGRKILMTHYPRKNPTHKTPHWESLVDKFFQQYPTGIHLFGHTHNNHTVTPFNMSVENNEYKPISLEEIFRRAS